MWDNQLCVCRVCQLTDCPMPNSTSVRRSQYGRPLVGLMRCTRNSFVGLAIGSSTCSRCSLQIHKISNFMNCLFGKWIYSLFLVEQHNLQTVHQLTWKHTHFGWYLIPSIICVSLYLGFLVCLDRMHAICAGFTDNNLRNIFAVVSCCNSNQTVWRKLY